jgi:hypothetical protein
VTRRYVRRLGSVSVGSREVVSYLVIETEEVPHGEVIEQGFVEIDASESPEAVKERYGVSSIYVVTDRRWSGTVN